MSKASIYIAAPYGARNGFRDIRAELERLGFRITSTWLDEKAPITTGTVGASIDIDDKSAAAHVRQDFRDIEACDVLIAFTEAAVKSINVSTVASSGGRHIETGYALAVGKHVILVGEPENIFHRTLTRAADWHHALVEVLAWHDVQPRAEAAS